LRSREVAIATAVNTEKTSKTKKRPLATSVLEDCSILPSRASQNSEAESGTDENIQELIEEFKQLKLDSTVYQTPQHSDSEQSDIMESCGVTIKLFADDAEIYDEVIDIRDVEKIQRALDLLVEWADLWQLKIAIKINKCFTSNIAKIPSCVLVSGTEYRIDDCILPSVAFCRELGISVSCDIRVDSQTCQCNCSKSLPES